VRKRSAIAILLVLLALAAMACASEVEEGTATLPEGIDSALLPSAELGGYMYFNTNRTVDIATERFLTSDLADVLPAGVPATLRLRRATIAVSSSPEEFGGTLEFTGEADAEVAWDLYQSAGVRDEFWGLQDQTKVHVVRGDTPWAEAVRSQLESGQLVPFTDHDPVAWNLITNLPKSDSRPLAVGIMTLEDELIQELASQGGIRLFGLNTVFSLIKVDNVAFGAYADSDLTVPASIGDEFFQEAGVGVVFVSKSGYPGFLVSYLLRSVANRIGLETIEIGDTNARYRQLDNLHVVLKNRGSLLYVAVAASQSDAERLILGALSD